MLIACMLIGHHAALLSNIGANDWKQCRHGAAFNVKGSCRTAAFNQCKSNIAESASAANNLFWSLLCPADYGFVDFNYFTWAAHGLNASDAHGLANAMAHKPSGFDSDAKHTV